MRTKHTPGPWGINERYGKPFSIYGPGDKAICSWQNVKRTDEEIEGNARLIAAAPELLEALQQIVSNISDFVECKQTHWMDSIVVLEAEDVEKAERWQSLIDLLAKATGETINNQS